MNSGAEADETALKLCRKWAYKKKGIKENNAKIIACEGNFHGRTISIISMSTDPDARNDYGPFTPGFIIIPYNDLTALENALKDPDVAGFLVEPIQGEAGVVLPANNFLDKLRKRCDATGSLLIFDEIQTAFGRTGFMFACDRYKIIPDIILLAKALGGGMPLGAFISSNEIMSAISSNPVLGHITTFGGHPVSCAAGDASLGVIIREKLAEKCSIKSEIFKSLLKHKLISEVRGEGLLLAIQLTDSIYVPYVVSNAHKYGLLLDFFLFCDSALRLAPPLIIEEDEISTACTLLLKLLDEASVNALKK
jgi:ornithine--oxo-acid transaminase